MQTFLLAFVPSRFHQTPPPNVVSSNAATEAKIAAERSRKRVSPVTS
jgi:hypothetical protein